MITKIIILGFPEECRLLKEWLDCGASVFFDFQESKEMKHSTIWFLLPKISNNVAYLIPYSRDEFIELHNNNGFDEMVNDLIPQIRELLVRKERSKRANTLPDYLWNRAFKKRYRRRF